MIVLDAGILIAYLDPADRWHDQVVELLVAQASEPLAISELTLAECLVRPVIAGRTADAQRAVAALKLERIGLPVGAADDLASVRASSGLRMPDAVVLHTARTVSAAVATTDRLLAREVEASGIRVLLADKET